MRDLTHLNSFSYDFHLRHVQYFLFGQRLVFPKGFRLTSMLSKLMNVYIYPPKFSWNHVCKGKVVTFRQENIWLVPLSFISAATGKDTKCSGFFIRSIAPKESNFVFISDFPLLFL